MRKNDMKLAVLSVLRADPDFSQLHVLGGASDREFRAFLRWLDQSGLALYLGWRLRQHGKFGKVPAQLRVYLENSLKSNHRRTEAMLCDFQKVSECFRARRIRHAFLKGFTLVPEFCPRAHLRHQSDIDILISAECEEDARAAIFECGYSLERKLPGGETHFSTPVTRIPLADDDIYRADYQKEIEVHTSIWQDIDHVSFHAPIDCLIRTGAREIKGIPFVSLSQEDVIIAQVLHVFRHVLSSWVRLSWLWEIYYFLSHHADDPLLWSAVRERAGNDPLLKNAFGFVLGLTNRLFASPIPEVLRCWCVDTLPDRINCWVSEFGTRWALSEIVGSKLSLFVHKEFVREPELWRAYFWRRMLPFAGKPALSKTNSRSTRRLRGFTMQHRLFQARRLVFHARSLVSFPVEAWRWKRALIQPNAGAQSLLAARASHES